ncbi:hypothetical protein FSP39_001812 [Pinctada imbricata]|uniref:HD domain-containing protein n=1 Tax=Pinctada imbricata TaxID=66713 RepID=A0AA89BVA0_PINIB|nr:hypothetical protein FSP39_001812 [Pinctada imbricata]
MDVVSEVISLYERHGDDDYLGESVSKTQHSIQCALLAEEEGYGDEVILGAFLHDIGHLIGADQGLDRMVTDGVNLGANNHDVIGGEFLRQRGFPKLVCDLVQGHVQAKRYLVWKNRSYRENLSAASKMTLEHQGGPMTDNEAEVFEHSEMFDLIIKMRTWDERGKDVSIRDVSLDKYKTLCRKVLNIS